LIHTCVLLLGKLFVFDPHRTTSQSLLAISSLSLSPVFVHNFRKALSLLEKSMSISDRSSFILAIADKLNFIDVNDFESEKSFGADKNCMKQISPKKNGGIRTAASKNKELLRQNSTPLMELSTRLATIVNSMWVLKSCNNEYRIPELYLKLANSYSYFAGARLRIDSYDALKGEHLSNKRYSEALMCELHVAARLAKHNATSEVYFFLCLQF